jgi:preprotein translocase SecE subunit
VARNRKRAKERRARRPQPVSSRRPEREEEETPGPIVHGTPDVELAEAQLAMGRPEPIEDAGAEESVADEPPLDPVEAELELEHEEELEDLNSAGDGGGAGGAGGELLAPGGSAPERRPHAGNRLIGFLQGSWRELQRVQWPDRRQVAQATGVVLGFVIVAGAFLGLSDLVAQKLVNFILK